MFKEYYAISVIDLILVTLCAVSYIFTEDNPWLILLFIFGFVISILLTGFSAVGIPDKRLKRCYRGSVKLAVFMVSLLITIIVFIIEWIDNVALGWQYPVLFAVTAFSYLCIYFWIGIIEVYTSSTQLGIEKRVIGLLCGMIPIANLIALSMIIYTTHLEVCTESKKYWFNERRKDEQICKTKYPLLMVHGVFFRDSEHLNYWGRVPAELIKNGATVYYGGQESAGPVRNCAVEIKDVIEKIVKETGCEKVNIIAHSKGGLDSRYAITKCGMAPYVASLTTINTPHKGCEFADYLLERAPESLKKSVAAAYNAGAKALGDKEPDFIKAVTDLTATGAKALRDEMESFEHVYDDEENPIFTQSYGSKLNKAVNGKFPLNLSYNLVKLFDGNNDGLVGEKSFPWGSRFQLLTNKGKRGISHADMIDLNRENIAGFDVREFYVGLVHDLKERGL